MSYCGHHSILLSPTLSPVTRRLPEGFHLSTVMVEVCWTSFVKVEVGFVFPSTIHADTMPNTAKA